MDPAVAREYALLALRCGRLVPGLVDFRAADPVVHGLRRRVEREPVAVPAALAAQARWIRAELARSGMSERRSRYLDRQVNALEFAMRRAAGAAAGFRAEVRAYFDTDIELTDPECYRVAHAELDAVLPGTGDLAARLADYRRAEEVPAALLGPFVQALSAALRAQAPDMLALPAGESVYYEVARDRPWSALNCYLGGYRSRVVVNADARPRLSQLARMVAHEAYPGHHTERCRAELSLAGPDRRLERAVFVVNTPQCVLSEGLADLGLEVLVGPAWQSWAASALSDTVPSGVVRSELGLSALGESTLGRSTLGRDVDGELSERVERVITGLLAVRQDAALMLHDRGAGEDEVLGYLGRWLLVPEQRARQMLRFLTHPLWRAYTTSYVEGHRLVRGWLDAGPVDEPVLGRYLRLLDEPLAPSTVRDELAAAELVTPSTETCGVDEPNVNVE